MNIFDDGPDHVDWETKAADDERKAIAAAVAAERERCTKDAAEIMRVAIRAAVTAERERWQAEAAGHLKAWEALKAELTAERERWQAKIEMLQDELHATKAALGSERWANLERYMKVKRAAIRKGE